MLKANLRHPMREFNGPDGKLYRLTHLKPTNYQVSITSNGTKYMVPLVVTYSNHCYSDGRNGTVQPTDPWYLRKDQSGHRAFCPHRWESSLDLPENVGYLINEALKCYDAQNHGNYLHLRNANAKYPGNGWYVMFKFKPADHPALVHMSIASHHFRTTYPTNIRNPRPKPFPMMLEQWIQSKPQLLKLLQDGQLPGTILVPTEPVITPEAFQPLRGVPHPSEPTIEDEKKLA